MRASRRKKVGICSDDLSGAGSWRSPSSLAPCDDGGDEGSRTVTSFAADLHLRSRRDDYSGRIWNMMVIVAVGEDCNPKKSVIT